jgi:hypothetical protein
LVGLPRFAEALDVTFAGSGSLEYHTFVGAKTGAVPQPSSIGIDGLTLELAQKVVLDVSKSVNVNVKVCYGCHGVELDQGYAELHWKDALSLRAGRINVPIGEFNARHDPANYSAPSKPLPYAMGDLLYYRANEFNLGVVPTPYSDNGAEMFGSFWLGKRVTLDYTLYVVRGLVGSNDLDFIESRSWTARKRYPSVGGRVVASFGPVSIGGSASWGYYDPDGKLMYLIYGAELYARWRTLTLRGEFIARQTDYDRSLPGYLYVPKEHYFIKAGYYAQLDWDPLSWLTVLARIDGLYRLGMPLPGSLITSDSASILRPTIAFLLRFGGHFLVKAGYEYWHFTGVPFEDEHVVRTALLFTY